MKAVDLADITEARFFRRVDAAHHDLPVRGTNGPGNNPPVIDSDPPGVNGSLGRGWTRWRRNPIRRLARFLFELPDALAERVNNATAAQVRTWLANRGITITLAQANRIKAVVAAATDEPDESPDDESVNGSD